MKRTRNRSALAKTSRANAIQREQMPPETARPRARSKVITTLERRNQLVEKHLHLVQSIAVRVMENLPHHVDREDLIHAGAVGLIKAAELFDEKKKIHFSTYAKFRIRGAMLDSLRQLDWASRDLRRKLKAMERETQLLRRSLQREPSEEEMAARFKMTTEQWRVEKRALQHVEIFSADTGSGTHTLVPEIPSGEKGPDRLYELAQMRSLLNGVLLELPARYRKMVKLYYSREKTMKEIGDALKVNESRVSQMHKLALEKLQGLMFERGIPASAFRHL
jgi:RNA polymerase sigma factor FliA